MIRENIRSETIEREGPFGPSPHLAVFLVSSQRLATFCGQTGQVLIQLVQFVQVRRALRVLEIVSLLFRHELVIKLGKHPHFVLTLSNVLLDARNQCASLA
jgi:hypothetical protein